ncbi:DUF5317 domain-containing protein [Alkaliphilus oremlandii]|uniref:DUF5317 domain-containing protein n=1 Tax=Alkaliphilus oremlandii (strain OhILAs) TaxID=350688 RepID=A8MJN6_ALKOO|nr:DUF5317 domain-containing protein [Alkaliphilus oremlandii]ABW20018.1 hypothetical protein Clos_2486 [Alkaliphilus oremlandii OhILAs]
MILEGLVLGIIIGKLRGGKVNNLGRFVFKSSFLLAFSLLIQLGTSILISVGNEQAIKHKMILYIISYIMLFIVLFLNLGKKSVWLIVIGAVLNFAAIVLNGGSMPMDLEALQKIGSINMLQSIKAGELVNYRNITEAVSFTVYLGKRITTPEWYPIKQVFSIGDLFISLGILFLCQSMMQSSRSHSKPQLLKFNHKGKMRL